MDTERIVAKVLSSPDAAASAWSANILQDPSVAIFAPPPAEVVEAALAATVAKIVSEYAAAVRDEHARHPEWDDLEVAAAEANAEANAEAAPQPAATAEGQQQQQQQPVGLT